MTTQRLTLEEDFEEPYTLLAIHCGQPGYKLAYLLNKHLKMQFRRKKHDLDFSTEGLLITFPIYDFEDAFTCTHFSLVANKCKTNEATLQSSGGLFSEMDPESSSLHHLLPEFKNVDYFLKIHSDFETVALDKVISGTNQIKQIVSAYQITTENIKSKNNLIFD